MEVSSLEKFVTDYLEDEREKNLLEKEIASFVANSPAVNPEMVFEWRDKQETGAVGWVVIDRVINQVTGGGIFMHGNATKQVFS